VRTRGRALPVAALVTLVPAVVVACGEGNPTGVIEREAFVATWVELRRAAIGARGVLSDSERARVLEEQQVSEEELLAFAEAHGDDPTYMAEVWTEIESRMRPPPADSVPQP
jgi:hypothetical protein